jgi:hypothetical protein
MSVTEAPYSFCHAVKVGQEVHAKLTGSIDKRWDYIFDDDLDEVIKPFFIERALRAFVF